MAAFLIRFASYRLSRPRLLLSCRSWQQGRRLLSSYKHKDDQERKLGDEDPSKSAATGMAARLKTSCTGTGQVVFLNSPESGAMVLASLAVCDPLLAVMAGTGSFVSTATAEASLVSKDISHGLNSYNGCLMGCATYALVFPGDIVTAVPLTVLGAATSTFLSAMPMTTPMPQWTLAFNLLTYTSLLALYKPAVVTQSLATAVPVSTFDLVVSPLTGLGQIFVAESPLTGLGIAVAMAMYSPLVAVHAIAGSAIGGLTGNLLSADASSLAAGLWGYNAALTSAGTAVFLKSHHSVWFVSAVGASTTAVLSGALSNVSPVPILTIPFCAVMSGIWWIAQGKLVRNVELAKVPHSPEKNIE